MTANKNQITIGLDLGDRRHAVCVLDNAGQITAEESLPNTRGSLEQLSQRYPGATVAMETGTHSPWVSRLFEARGHTVYVANARKVRAISQSVTKSDEQDARMLARLCRADPSLLSPIKHRSERCQRDLVQLKARESLVRARVDLMNSTRFLLKSLGLAVPSQVKATAFVRKLRPLIEEASAVLIEPLLQSIDALSVQIEVLEDKLEALSRDQYPDTERLRQIPGIGPITALCYVLTLESPGRFAHNRDVGPYLGLVPRRDQSGSTDKPLPITKAGNTHLRCLLVNCAHYICVDAKVTPVLKVPTGVEVTMREGTGGNFLFVLNHTSHRVRVPLRSLKGFDLIVGRLTDGILSLAPGDAKVLKLTSKNRGYDGQTES